MPLSTSSLMIVLLTYTCSAWHNVNLPDLHMPFYFTNNQHMAGACLSDDACPYKHHVNTGRCWGYEVNCGADNVLHRPECPGSASGWEQTKAAQLKKFWQQSDFGYVQQRLQELTVICEPTSKDDSSLLCSKYTEYCRATNLYLDLTGLKSSGKRERYRENIFKLGQIGGRCKMYEDRLRAFRGHKSALQSWYAELEMYRSIDHTPKCDITLDKPTILMKLDAGVNLYHHFCDFINLYASQHVNNSFATDINILMWDTSDSDYYDLFSDTWSVFSDRPPIHLREFDGKKVCVHDAVFSLLPRMVYGLYYNMPLIPGCRKSSLFSAFSQHVVHRLKLHQAGPLRRIIRITLVYRDTKYRNILNQAELVGGLKTVGSYEVNEVKYHKSVMNFTSQLNMTHNSDIFISMHGATLTHLIFQPDWGVAFELYNCEDSGCYRDLAYQRGVHYMTWENTLKLHQQDEGHHPTLGAHAKFTNYGFDLIEFLRLVKKAEDHIVSHPAYRAAHSQLHGKQEL